MVGGAFFLLVLGWLVVVGCYQLKKPLPPGIDYRGELRLTAADQVTFLHDLTFADHLGRRVLDQQIFDALFSLLEQAHHYILLDMFLFNNHQGMMSSSFRPLAQELTDLLIRKKREIPSISIDVISDPINSSYGGSSAKELDQLRAAGINVIITDVKPLRDSNPLYSSVWRTFFQWFGNSKNGGRFKHPFAGDGQQVSLRSYLALLNFKANHRKICVADHRGEMVTIITSANPHDASAAHSNAAFRVTGDLWRDVYRSEAAVAAFSGGRLSLVGVEQLAKAQLSVESTLQVQLLTEKRIKHACLEIIGRAGHSDTVSMAMFYLADRQIIRSLLQAAKRGAEIRIILDPNKDAFGYRKNGIPNRPVAHELVQKSGGRIHIRWYDTHGEQFHTKMIIGRKADGTMSVLLGSANLTRRNIDNFNLESDVLVVGNQYSLVMRRVADYFEAVWHNTDDRRYTVPYDAYAESSDSKTIQYRLQEGLGLGTF